MLRDVMLEKLKVNLMKAKQRMKFQADKKRRDVKYQVEDLVYLNAQPYRLKLLARLVNLAQPHFYGPYAERHVVWNCLLLQGCILFSMCRS